MNADDPLIGIRVRVVIEEDGTQNPPKLPLGTIIRRLVGTDRVNYYMIHLDNPVTCIRASEGQTWNLVDLFVAPKFQGGNLARLLGPATNRVIIGIANALAKIEDDDPLIDFSKGEYFATGYIEKVA